MIIVGNDRFPNEANLTPEVQKLKKDGVFQLPTSPSGRPQRGQAAGISDLNGYVKSYLEDERKRLKRTVQEQLGGLQLSEAMNKMLEAQFNSTKDNGDPIMRLNTACKIPSGAADGAPDVGPEGFQAKKMSTEEAKAKLDGGTFSCPQELAWTLYSARGFRSGKSYTAASSEEKVSNRPTFTPETQKQRKEYVKQADLGDKQVDLRHVISSTTLNKALAKSDDSLKDMDDFLENNGWARTNNMTAIREAVFYVVHSHLGNLWPGGAADNQAAGTMHGKLNRDALNEASRTKEVVTMEDELSVAKSHIASNASISDCTVNDFLVDLANLDESVGEELGKAVKDGTMSVEEVNACVKPLGDLNDKIRKKVGVGENGYTVKAMESDLKEWLAKNPAPSPSDNSMKASVTARLRALCETEANFLDNRQKSGVFKPDQRVDDCDLTTYLQELGARAEISEEEQAFLTSMRADEGVKKSRQESQELMVSACVDYLQARSIACDRLRSDQHDVPGYTQKDFVGDLQNLAANFDFDLPQPVVPGMKIETLSEDYTTKLIGIELALLNTKAGEKVSLFKKGPNGEPSVMDQFMALDYKENIKVETKMEVEETPERKSKKNKRGQDRESEAGLLPDETAIHMSSPGKVEPGVGSPPDPLEPKLKRQKQTDVHENSGQPGQVGIADASVLDTDDKDEPMHLATDNQGTPSAKKSVGQQMGMKKFETKGFMGHSSSHFDSNPFNPKPGQGKGQSFGKKT